MTPRISVSEPDLCGNEKAYVLECLESSWISSRGRFIDLFEEAFRDYIGVRHAITTSNGTASLHVALSALGVKPGDEVIVPALTYVAPASAALHLGASPVAVDIDPGTWNLTAEAVRAALTPRTRGVIAVHLYGNPVDLDPLQALCGERGLWLIEDAAEALGSEYRGRRAGSFGDLACFSFYGNKTISTGEGGMITTDDDRLARTIRQLKDQGQSPGRRYWHDLAGFNFRMTNIQAAIGLAQMEQVERLVSRKRAIADSYRRHLAGPLVAFPDTIRGGVHSHWMTSVRLNPGTNGLTRDAVMERLEQQGIETRPFFYPLHQLPIFQGRMAGRFPVAEEVSACGLNLPSSTRLREADVERVSRALLECLSHAGQGCRAATGAREKMAKAS
jgi:perosamine synthetase